MTRHEFRDQWWQLIRNGRWGTCSGCPRDNAGFAHPHLCENTERYDHYLTEAALVAMGLPEAWK